MSKIKYLILFCFLMLLAVGFAATASAGEQPADMIIAAADHNADGDLIFGMVAMGAKPVEDKKNTGKHEDEDEESVKEDVYGDGQKQGKINNDNLEKIKETTERTAEKR